MCCVYNFNNMHDNRTIPQWFYEEVNKKNLTSII